jgi:hypothetical protein
MTRMDFRLAPTSLQNASRGDEVASFEKEAAHLSKANVGFEAFN